jgi:excisionase family DNA binding protein
MDERLLKADEVSRILNISRALTYRLLQRGDIPVVRINHAVRVKPSDLDEFINKCRSEGSSIEL